MVCRRNRPSFGRPGILDRDRLRAGGGKLERKSLPGLVVAPPDRRSRLCPYLLHEPGLEQLGYDLQGLAALRTRWRNQAMVIALRPALRSTSCVSLNLIVMFEPSRFGSQ